MNGSVCWTLKKPSGAFGGKRDTSESSPLELSLHLSQICSGLYFVNLDCPTPSLGLWYPHLCLSNWSFFSCDLGQTKGERIQTNFSRGLCSPALLPGPGRNPAGRSLLPGCQACTGLGSNQALDLERKFRHPCWLLAWQGPAPCTGEKDPSPSGSEGEVVYHRPQGLSFLPRTKDHLIKSCTPVFTCMYTQVQTHTHT